MAAAIGQEIRKAMILKEKRDRTSVVTTEETPTITTNETKSPAD